MLALPAGVGIACAVKDPPGAQVDDLLVLHHRFRSLVEHALDAFFIKDLQGRYLLINPAGARMLGLPVAEIVGKNDAALFPADEAKEIMEVDRRVVATGRPVTYQTIRTVDAGEAAFFTKKYPFFDADGRLAGTMGVSHDVTDWYRAQRAARRADSSFRTLIERSPDLVLVHSRGRILYVNQAALRRLGYASNQILGSNPLHHVRPQDRRMLLVGETQTPEGEARPPVEVGLLTEGGEVVLVEIVDLVVHWDGRGARAYFARDISERRQLESRLAEADRLASLGTLAAGVAHEVNNPLTFVLNHLEGIASRLPDLARDAFDRGDSDEALELEALATAAAESASGARRIASTVRDLMAYARGEGETLGAADLARAVDKAIQVAFHQIRHRARLVNQLTDLPTVRGHEARLSQVFVNLLVNAAQAIPPGDAENNAITLSADVDDELVRVHVQDTGDGIPEAIRDRIFEPFVSTKVVGEGTGLGLWVCHGIVRQHGGQITLQTGGTGTTFTVELRRAIGAAPAARSLPPEGIRAPGPSASRPRVLVVDDEELIGQLLTAGLSSIADVVAVTSGRAAQAHLQEGVEADLILCDLMMPDVTGADLFGWIEEHRPELASRVVFMTGGAFTDRDRKFLDARKDQHLAKPFRLDEVRELVRASTDSERT